ncbi:MAG: hypothetical protein QME66_10955 [Candidatus Eisenbacteria bacterium]|nr:hypothetical protein [Candidatus Eisenbacteria bacterium]
MLWSKVLGFAKTASGRELKTIGDLESFRLKPVRSNGDDLIAVYHESWKKANGIHLHKWCFCQPYVRLLRTGVPVNPASVDRVEQLIGHKAFPWVAAVLVASGIVRLGSTGLEIKTRLCLRCNRRFPGFLADCPSCSPP